MSSQAPSLHRVYHRSVSPAEEIDSHRLELLGLRRPPANEPGLSRKAIDLLARLRAATPRRALTHRESERVAERQAERLRGELDLSGTPRLPTEALIALPFLTVTERTGFFTSGMATKTPHGWIIVLRSEEAKVRQRFSLAHELRHLLDDPFIDRLYPASRGYSSFERAERVCDYFAGCLLMPKRLLRADWVDGRQDVAALARRYDVSRAAMTVRLSQLGLLPDTPRCAIPYHGGH